MPLVLTPRAVSTAQPFRSLQDADPTAERPQALALAGPRLGWQLAQQHGNEKVLKRRSFCASIK